ncbi:MAG: LysM peptidoglycan-binding domain-containing protein [Anaerolineales bacterium]|nr:LysM peptidoglycan-binding domain-containing protein [Anaerolineales bacterium]
MSTEESKKPGVFTNLINLVSTRDEKEALEQALKELEEARKAAAAAELTAKSTQSQAQASARIALTAATKRAAEAEARIKALETQLRDLRMAEAQRQAKEKMLAAEARLDAMQAPKFIAEHTLKADESLSHLALKYYKHATKPYWMVIYEANKAVIGDNPNKVRVGTVLKIPELPANLKK